jgi:hypothetical protein
MGVWGSPFSSQAVVYIRQRIKRSIADMFLISLAPVDGVWMTTR